MRNPDRKLAWVRSILSLIFRRKKWLLNHSDQSEFIETAGATSIVGSYVYLVNRTPTYDHIYGEVISICEGW